MSHPTQEQIAYVRKELAEGHSQENIKVALTQNGYNEELIASIFKTRGMDIA